MSDLTSDEMRGVLMGALNEENRKGQFDLGYDRYIKTVDKYLPHRVVEFWTDFFKQVPEADRQQYSARYLRKRFIVAVFASGQDRSALYSGFELSNSEKEWILDEIRETCGYPHLIQMAEQRFRVARR
jgi:hypothetical protein